MVRSLNDIRLRDKMLLVFVLAVFIPVVLTNVIFYQITTNNVKNQKLSDINRALDQIRNNILDQIDASVGISSVLYNDAVLMEYLDKEYDSPADYVDNYHTYILHVLEKYSPVYQVIQSVTLYSDNPTLLFGGRVLQITDEVRKQAWYRKLTENASTLPIIEWNHPDFPGLTPNAISVIRSMNDPGGFNQTEKFLKIDLHPEKIADSLRNVTLEGQVYLIEGDRILLSTDPDRASAEPVPFVAPSRSNGSIVLEKDFGNVSYLKGWKIVGEFDERKVLEEVRKSREFVIYMAIPNIVVPTIIIIWFTRSLNNRIIRILKHMKRVKNHSFEPINDKPSADEIGQLTGEFNRMTLQIKSLIQDVYLADIQKKELQLSRNQSQLHALQSQINPHFLFNSLETIRMRSLMKQETETAKMIHNMAKIFRKSLTWGKDWITVKDELDLVECFLEIQKYRFGDKLNYEIRADDEVLKAMIPKMSLQPLVENASIHGIEPLKESGKIIVEIRKVPGGIVYIVQDNGVGIPAEKLEQLLRALDNEEEAYDRVGIRNVFLRLKGYYGDRVDYRVQSTEGEGTEIVIFVEDEPAEDESA
ncbi:cache domain-containing sensor histidine kinase [Cohnella candidum]|uniref:Sensor histidine kinase n=1 Tax=Cohnella candidum TaxID=2674991 RepID=A0A3G3K0B7_9BACL|nr:sensor histidine kinase [Cohnella candidum]AYQ73946.1 sensor histidine kinase [Cohnella candidum]